MSRSAIAALILANLLVAVQAVRGGWGYYETLLIYWCEALIIGAYNVVRLLLVGVLGRAPLGATIGQWVDLGPWYNRLFLTVVGAGFFVAKFGAFALAVGFLVVALPAGLPDTGSSRDMRVLEGLRAVGPGLFIAVVALLVSHGVSFVRNFLLRRESLHMNVLTAIVWPYARMFLVAVVLAGGLVVVALAPELADATAFTIVIILLKLGADAASHFFEHRWIAAWDAKNRAIHGQI